MISLRQIISRSAIPIFAIFSLKESVFGANDRSGLFLPHEAMLNAVFAVVVCLSASVCVSVCMSHRYCITSSSAMAEGPSDTLICRPCRG